MDYIARPIERHPSVPIFGITQWYSNPTLAPDYQYRRNIERFDHYVREVLNVCHVGVSPVEITNEMIAYHGFGGHFYSLGYHVDSDHWVFDYATNDYFLSYDDGYPEKDFNVNYPMFTDEQVEKQFEGMDDCVLYYFNRREMLRRATTELKNTFVKYGTQWKNTLTDMAVDINDRKQIKPTDNKKIIRR